MIEFDEAPEPSWLLVLPVLFVDSSPVLPSAPLLELPDDELDEFEGDADEDEDDELTALLALIEDCVAQFDEAGVLYWIILVFVRGYIHMMIKS